MRRTILLIWFFSFLAWCTVRPANAQSFAAEVLLREAAGKGDIPMIGRLLQEGVRPDGTETSGATALIAAAYRNQTEAARALIEAGADVNRQDSSGQSAFLIAVSNANIDLVKLALRRGANLDSRDGGNASALIRAARHGHGAVTLELLRGGAELNQVTRAGRTALIETIVMGDGGRRHADTVRFLVKAGADLSIRDHAGLSALQHALQREFREIAAILISAGGR